MTSTSFFTLRVSVSRLIAGHDERRIIVAAVMCLSIACARSLQAQPQNEITLSIQEGHSGATSIDYSPDGKYMVSGGADGSIVKWEVATGRAISRAENEDGREITKVAMSPGGEHYLSLNVWGEGMVRSFRDDSVAFIFDSHFNGAAAYSHSGAHVLTGHLGGEWNPIQLSYIGYVSIRDASTGHELNRLSGHHSYINDAGFSHNDKLIVTAGHDSTAIIWDATSGEVVRRLEGFESAVICARFSPDDSRIITCDDHGKVTITDASSGEPIHHLDTWNGSITRIAVAPQGSIIATFGGTLKVWNYQTGLEILDFHGVYSSFYEGLDRVDDAAFSPDGKYLAVGERDDPTIHIVDLRSGLSKQFLKGYNDEKTPVNVSSNGNYAVAASASASTIWDLADGKPIGIHPTDFITPPVVDISDDGNTIVFGSWGGVHIGRVGYSTPYKTVGPSNDRIIQVDYLEETDNLFFAGEDGSWGIWSTDRDSLIANSNEVDAEPVRSVAISPNERFVVRAFFDGSVSMYDRLDSTDVVILPVDENNYPTQISDIDFSSDSNYFVTAGSDGKARVWDTTSGSLHGVFSGHSSPLESAKFSGEDYRVVSTDYGGSIRVWEILFYSELAHISGQQGYTRSAHFVNNGESIIASGFKNSARVVDLHANSILAELFSFNDGTWATVSPDGRFDAEDIGNLRGLNWTAFGSSIKTYSLDLFARDRYEPRLLARLLSGEDFPELKPFQQTNLFQPVIGLEFANTAQTNVSVRLEVTVGAESDDYPDSPPFAKDLRLFRNGQLVAWRDGPIEYNETIVFKDISLPSADEENIFSAYVFNSDDVKSETSEIVYSSMTLGPAESRAYVISFGVNTFSNPQLNLQYAANDARLFQRLLPSHLESTDSFDEIIPVPLIADGDSGTVATKEALRKVLSVLSGSSEKASSLPFDQQLSKATPNDVVYLTFATHGFTAPDGMFYLVPSDVGQDHELGNDLMGYSISSEELATWLRPIDAAEINLIVDACYSAASISRGGYIPGPFGGRGLGQLAYNKGINLIAASQEDATAAESDLLQQGLLSYSLLEDGLEENAADLDADGQISTVEWMTYGALRVPVLNKEIRAGEVLHPITGQPRTGDRGVEPMGSSWMQQPQFFPFGSQLTRSRMVSGDRKAPFVRIADGLGAVTTWDPTQNTKVYDAKLKRSVGTFYGGQFSGGGRLVTTNYELTRIWNADSSWATIPIRDFRIVAVSHQASFLLVEHVTGAFKLVDTRAGTSHDLPYEGILDADFSSDNLHLLVATEENIIHALNVENAQPVSDWTIEVNAPIGDIHFSASGKQIVVADTEGVQIYDYNTQLPLWRIDQAEVYVSTLSPNEQLLFTSGNGGEMIWRSNSLTEPIYLDGHSRGIGEVRFSRDSQHLITSSHDSSVILWEATTGEQIWSKSTTTSSYTPWAAIEFTDAKR